MMILWFSLTLVSVIFIASDLIFRTPEMKVMKWGWILVALYTGPVAAVVYWFSCREPAPGTHEKFVAPLWKQAVGSTIHCLAGDATGIIVAAAITLSLGLPMHVDVMVEYGVGFLFGLLVFQALFMKDMLGGGYLFAIRQTVFAEWVSMNCVMAAMIPVMAILMSRNMLAMHPSSPAFWFAMSMATLAGAVAGVPVNYWLVKNNLKHGMGTERTLGKGGSTVPGPASHEGMEMPAPAQPTDAGKKVAHVMTVLSTAPDVAQWRKVMVALATIVLLAIGVAAAERWGNLLHPDATNNGEGMTMPS